MTHPAPYTKPVLETITQILAGYPPDTVVLDPYAGTGLIHTLPYHTIGIELEPEWATQHPHTIHGDTITTMETFPPDIIDVIATSPTFGNRLADTYLDHTKRHTYRSHLDHPLDANNTGIMQWGPTYRAHHLQAWTQTRRLLKPNGLFILNLKDHIRNGKRQEVTLWHLTVLNQLGFHIIDRIRIPSRGIRFGANSHLRVNFEEIITLT